MVPSGPRNLKNDGNAKSLLIRPLRGHLLPGGEKALGRPRRRNLAAVRVAAMFRQALRQFFLHGRDCRVYAFTFAHRSISLPGCPGTCVCHRSDPRAFGDSAAERAVKFFHYAMHEAGVR